jgi:hypothetical protein
MFPKVTIFSLAGIDALTCRVSYAQRQKTLDAAAKVSSEQSSDNWKKHVAATRASAGYKGNITFSGSDGMLRSVSRGTIAMDGEGRVGA